MKCLDLADTLPYENEYTTVELLQENDYYLDIVLLQRTEAQDGLYFLSFVLRWILTGLTGECEVNRKDTSM